MKNTRIGSIQAILGEQIRGMIFMDFGSSEVIFDKMTGNPMSFYFVPIAHTIQPAVLIKSFLFTGIESYLESYLIRWSLIN